MTRSSAPLPPREEWSHLIESHAADGAAVQAAKDRFRVAVLELRKHKRAPRPRSPDHAEREAELQLAVAQVKLERLHALQALGKHDSRLLGRLKRALKRDDKKAEIRAAWLVTEPRPPATRLRAYVSNYELACEFKASHLKGSLTPKLWELFNKIATKVVYHPHFNRYSFRYEMVTDAVIAQAENWELIDPRVPNCNIFAYLTQVCFTSYYVYLKLDLDERKFRAELFNLELALSGFGGEAYGAGANSDDSAYATDPESDKGPKPDKQDRPSRARLPKPPPDPEEAAKRRAEANQRRWAARRLKFGPTGAPKRYKPSEASLDPEAAKRRAEANQRRWAARRLKFGPTGRKPPRSKSFNGQKLINSQHDIPAQDVEAAQALQAGEGQEALHLEEPGDV